ncbi:cysteine--tRNA ligase [Gammaproteobacteria bacterium]|nr:cysteine--tRNA ligase [Gammaproteobacteria bacterium]
MSLLLHNTLSRGKEEFVPAEPGRVSVYVCGPTVYNRPHIGNARPAVVFDVLVRFLRTRYAVTYVRNITDIDDKINAAAEQSGESIEVIAARHVADYHADMDALGVLPPDIEPFATHHLSEMTEMIATLIAAGHAYEAEGHVLFRVNSYSDYGMLSRRDRRQLLDGARVEVAPYKEDAGDFILWKPSTPEQPGWDSPWGRGRPGWHIECSAMAATHLGITIDIHGGGNDLIFPHHENEIAQSTCAHGGAPFSRYWLHNGFVNIDHTKMSKSLGNVVLVRDLLEQAPGEVVRLALLAAHYRQPLDWSDDVLGESRRKLDRLYNALRNVGGWAESWRDAEPSAEFVTAMEDDINTPRAIAALFNLAREINRLGDTPEAQALARQLRAGSEVIGLLGSDPDEWFESAGAGDVASDEIDALVEQRTAARTAKDFAEADRIRDVLVEMGIIIEDGPEGARWRRASDLSGNQADE